MAGDDSDFAPPSNGKSFKRRDSDIAMGLFKKSG